MKVSWTEKTRDPKGGWETTERKGEVVGYLVINEGACAVVKSRSGLKIVDLYELEVEE